MPADLLVVTASKTFGESIRRTMEETDLYRVHVVNNKATAIVRAEEAGVALAIIDFALGAGGAQENWQSLRTSPPGKNIILAFDDNQKPPPSQCARRPGVVRKRDPITAFAG